MAKKTIDRDPREGAPDKVSRRSFLSKGAAGVGAAALAGVGAQEAQAQAPVKWDLLGRRGHHRRRRLRAAAAITARDLGASVIIVDENFDIGGRGMLSGGRVHLGGGHALQQKVGIKDIGRPGVHRLGALRRRGRRYSDRDLVRVFADENVPTFNFLIENGVKFIEKPIGPEAASTVPRTFVTVEWQNQDEIYAPRRRPQRLRPGAPARTERAQEGRADPAAARDEEDRPREVIRQGARHRGRSIRAGP